MASHHRPPAAVQCRTDPPCRRVACFQIRLHAQSGEVLGQPVRACADHLGGLVAELARSARADGAGDGYLQVSAIAPDAPPAPARGADYFPFASIALAL